MQSEILIAKPQVILPKTTIETVDISKTKPKRGRPFKYHTEEERQEARKWTAIRQHCKPFTEALDKVNAKLEEIENKFQSIRQQEIITTRRLDKHAEMIRDNEIRLNQMYEIIQDRK